MSTRISLLYLDLPDGASLHIYQEAFTQEVWIEETRLLCTVKQWNAIDKDQGRRLDFHGEPLPEDAP